MIEMKYFDAQMFTAETNTTVSTDLEPAISIDHTNKLKKGIRTLQNALGITEMTPMAAGTVIKTWKEDLYQEEPGMETVAEGDKIPLTKASRWAGTPITMTLKKWRKRTTAEAIQKTGYEIAINHTDELLLARVRKNIKDAFFTTIKAGTGTATGATNLQGALASLWGALQVKYEDMDVTPVFFVHPTDVATYLGSATITMQNAFGLSYIENFLGLGNAFVTTGVEAGKPMATVAQNLNGAYVPAGGDLARTFGLTYDETGLVGMKHYTADAEASLDTLLMTGVVFYAEDGAGIFKCTITE